MESYELEPSWPARVSARILIVAITLMPVTLTAQVEWTGDIGEDWFENGNWHTGALPDGDDIVHIDTADPNFTAVRQIGAQTEQLHVGFEDIGELIIEDGGEVISNDRGRIGRHAGSEGLVTVSGANSRWVAETSLLVGEEGSGMLIIESGGTVVDGFSSRIGAEEGAEGVVIVTGSGSLWESGGFAVGFRGTGVLIVEDGGTVTGGSNIGSLESGQGMVSVTGEGSEWILPHRLRVGSLGQGSLIVADSGVVNSADLAVIGGDVGSGGGFGGAGEVLVTGTGSELSIGEELFVSGPGGTGHLTVANSGRVQATEVIIPETFTGATGGAVNVGAAPGEAPATPGFVDTGLIDIARQDAVLNFNHTGTHHEFTADISGEGAIHHLSGSTVLSGDGSMFEGDIEVSGGFLDVQTSLGGAVNVLAGGALAANGAIGDATIAGILAGEDATGLLEVGGNLVFDAGSTWRAKADGLGSGELIAVDGDVVLNGLLQLVDASGLEEGVYTLMTYSGSLADTGMVVAGTPAGLGARFDSSISGEIRIEVFSEGIFADRFEQ